MSAIRHARTIGDEELKLTLSHSGRPVAVLFLGGDPDRMWFVSQLFERCAAEFQDRAHFVRIYVAENPSISSCLMNVLECSEIVVYRHGQPKARLYGEFTTVQIWKLVEAALAERYR